MIRICKNELRTCFPKEIWPAPIGAGANMPDDERKDSSGPYSLKYIWQGQVCNEMTSGNEPAQWRGKDLQSGAENPFTEPSSHASYTLLLVRGKCLRVFAKVKDCSCSSVELLLDNR